MINLHLSYQYIHWTKPALPPPSLSPGIERLFITTPEGQLEILYAPAYGKPTPSSCAPLLFIHGGMGSAFVWLEYMTYLSGQGIPCYALSLRGHGESWHPSYLRMVYGTTKRDLAEDLVAGAKWVSQREDASGGLVLVGHSSGGGLSQFVLSEGNLSDISVKGLVLVAAVPGSGSYRVYLNWWLLDPWFVLRMIFHLGHPNSPLSHPALTHKVFFSDAVSDQYVFNFQMRINAYDSLLWPMGMMSPFVNAKSVVRQLFGWGNGQRILVLAGGGDRLMTVDVMGQLATFYRKAIRTLVGEKKLETDGPLAVLPEGEEGMKNAGDGVRLNVVPGAGHHLQNDAQWKVGADELLDFYHGL